MMPHSTDSQSENLSLTKSSRTHTWLQQQLDYIWCNHFADVERLNSVTIEWGRTNRNRLGSITGKGGTRDNPARSEIRINSLMRDEQVPLSVIQQTIAHELAHYTHGFCSPHPQKFKDPHRGGVIEKELFSRNLTDVYEESEAWLKANWRDYISDTIGLKPKRITRSYRAPRLSLLQNLTQAITGADRIRRRRRRGI